MCGSVGTNQCCCVGVCSLHCYLNLLIVTSTCSDLPVVCNNPAHLHLINKQCLHFRITEITFLYLTETRAGNFNQAPKKEKLNQSTRKPEQKDLRRLHVM